MCLARAHVHRLNRHLAYRAGNPEHSQLMKMKRPYLRRRASTTTDARSKERSKPFPFPLCTALALPLLALRYIRSQPVRNASEYLYGKQTEQSGLLQP